MQWSTTPEHFSDVISTIIPPLLSNLGRHFGFENVRKSLFWHGDNSELDLVIENLGLRGSDEARFIFYFYFYFYLFLFFFVYLSSSLSFLFSLFFFLFFLLIFLSRGALLEMMQHLLVDSSWKDVPDAFAFIFNFIFNFIFIITITLLCINKIVLCFFSLFLFSFTLSHKKRIGR